MTSSPKHRILVVDDEKLLRWSLKEHLSRIGYETLAAETGELALESVRVRKPDVIVLDVRLPGIDGTEVLRQAMAVDPDIAVIMMSAHATVDSAVDAMKLGALDFLVKPFKFEDLDDCVERALALKRVRAQIARSPDSDSALAAIIGSAPCMEEIRAMVARLAASDAGTVLIDGESGAGKEVVARAIHAQSPRAAQPFCQLNCAALPEQLLESELFGHERGAFTGAFEQKRGLFETADHGTIMLDEIGELPPAGQAKLLQLLGNRTFRRVGGTAELKSSARLVCATNVDLEQAVAKGTFRADLYHRLNVIAIRVPPLRERIEDVPELAAHFIATFDGLGHNIQSIAPATLDVMSSYEWPGNVRELRNVVERALILNPDATELRPEHLPPRLRSGSLAHVDPTSSARMRAANSTKDEPIKLEEMEQMLIKEALDRNNGNQSQAARDLGISRDALRYRMKKHGMLE